ncbi:unnamed protein product [Chrysodeixis includens]|uniref:Uncharacterized protein n=1 Tax=Chrysodeixis includens TaxID=689277 RepID=A0A9P0FUX0_CHRIL|nr:unnamed protein product [Chrysodeixis includens]
MAAFKCLLLLSLVYSVIAVEGKIFNPCNKDDIPCLSAATEAFLEKTHNGVPDSNIKAIDPFIIPELDVIVDEEMGLFFTFTNVNVTGLKRLQILDYKMDTDKKSVVLKTKADVNIVADLNIKFTKKNNKSFNGLYQATTTAAGTSNYGYSLVKKQDNEIYFEVGPETNNCDIFDEPEVTLGDELLNALNNDQDARQLKTPYEQNKVSLRKRTLCKIVDSAYVVVINNLRTLATTLPAKNFFNGAFEPCSKDDVPCVVKGTEDFLSATYKGIKEYDIKPLDPLFFPNLDVVVDEEIGLIFKFTNLNVTGLKNMKLLDYKMATDTKSVEYKTKTILHLVSDVDIKLNKNNKHFNGLYTATTTAFETVNYHYSLEKKGDIEHFVIGPETTTCEIIEEPEVTLSDELQTALNNDEDVTMHKKNYAEKKFHIRKTTLCKIMDACIAAFISNVRTLTAKLPKTAFFKDI